MNPTARIFALIVGLSTTSAFAQADLSEAFLPMFMPLPAEVASPTNELTEAKINLGRQLYFETRISKGGKMSCNMMVSQADMCLETTMAGPAGMFSRPITR